MSRLVMIDLHMPAIEGFFAIPVEHLSAVPILAEAVRPLGPSRSIIVDDMLSTGGTIEAAMKALVAAGCRAEATVAVSHGLSVGQAAEILLALPIPRIFTTHSVTQRSNRLPVEVHSLADPAFFQPPLFLRGDARGPRSGVALNRFAEGIRQQVSNPL